MSHNALLAPSRRSPLRALASAALWLIAASLPLALFALCALDEQMRWYTLGGLAACVIGWQALRRFDAWYERRMLTQELQQRLDIELASGALDVERDTQQVEALRHRFWRERQLEALGALKVKLKAHPQRRDMLDALRDEIEGDQGARLLKLWAGCEAVTAAILLMMASFGPPGAAEGMGAVMLLMTGVFTVGFGYWLLLGAWWAHVESRHERRELVLQTRRTASVIELSGGLSLSDEELSGALTDARAEEET